jgi:plastocyanin
MRVAAGRERAVRSWRLAAALICACAVNYDATAAEPAAVRNPVSHTIVIDGVKYVPETLTVKRGDTVVWINKDPYPHTATAKGAFDSGSIAAGASWRLKPRKAGDYAYICTLHPNMKATLKVE